MHNFSSYSFDYLRSDPLLLKLADLANKCNEIAQKAGLDYSEYVVLRDRDWLNRVFSRLSADVSIMVIGQVSSGKSSFINSLLGRKLLLPSGDPTDGIISTIRYASSRKEERAEKVLLTGEVIPFNSLEEGLKFIRQQNTPSHEQLACKEVRMYVHDSKLRNFRFINTPGLGDRLDSYEKVTLDYLGTQETDLVVWTFQLETAANSSELAIFSKNLATRKKTVLGIVTGSLSGHEHDVEYDPHSDEQKTSVLCSIEKHLGEYLDRVILYDSHVVRTLVEQLSQEPDKESDENFKKKMQASGYCCLQDYLNERLGGDFEKIEEARAKNILVRCQEYAIDLSRVARAASKHFEEQRNYLQERKRTWNEIQKNVIFPAKTKMRVEIGKLADQKARELVLIMGNAAADAIRDNFSLIGTLGRSLFSKIKLCDSAGAKLNASINQAVEYAIEHERFNERLNSSFTRVMKDQIRELYVDLDLAVSTISGPNDVPSMEFSNNRPVGNSSDILGDAIRSAILAGISALAKKLAQEIEQKAAQEAAEKVVAEGAKKIIEQGAGQAAKEAAKASAAATAARLVNIVTLVLIPFDINKLINDFDSNKDKLITLVKDRYNTQTSYYRTQIEESIWEKADDFLEENVFKDLHDAIIQPSDQDAENDRLLGLAQKYGDRLEELSGKFREKLGKFR